MHQREHKNSYAKNQWNFDFSKSHLISVNYLLFKTVKTTVATHTHENKMQNYCSVWIL